MNQDEQEHFVSSEESLDELYNNAGFEEEAHKHNRFRVRKRVFHKNKRNLTLRDKLIYYIIIVFGVAVAVLITWYVLQAISNPNIATGIIKD